MKYVLSWKKKRHGTTADFEEGQRRVIETMRSWRRPEGVSIREFVVRVGEPGGYVVFEADELVDVHRETQAFSSLNFVLEPVIDVDEALRPHGIEIAWRDAVV